jgi:hypothetical protein
VRRATGWDLGRCVRVRSSARFLGVLIWRRCGRKRDQDYTAMTIVFQQATASLSQWTAYEIDSAVNLLTLPPISNSKRKALAAHSLYVKTGQNFTGSLHLHRNNLIQFPYTMHWATSRDVEVYIITLLISLARGFDSGNHALVDNAHVCQGFSLDRSDLYDRTVPLSTEYKNASQPDIFLERLQYVPTTFLPD